MKMAFGQNSEVILSRPHDDQQEGTEETEMRFSNELCFLCFLLFRQFPSDAAPDLLFLIDFGTLPVVK